MYVSMTYIDGLIPAHIKLVPVRVLRSDSDPFLVLVDHLHSAR